MSNKFLTTSSGSIDLSNGTVDIFAESLGADSLEASRPLRTNHSKQIISSNLEISDINDLSSELTTKNELSFVNDDIHSNPVVGQTKLYTKADGQFYTLDSSGTEQQIAIGGGSDKYELIPTSSTQINGITYSQEYDKTTWQEILPYSSNNIKLYNYFSDAVSPTLNINTMTNVTTTTCTTEAELDTAISNQENISISGTISISNTKVFNYPVVLQGGGFGAQLSGSISGNMIEINSDNSVIQYLNFDSGSFDSTANIIHFSSSTASNNRVSGCHFQLTNKSAITSNNASISILYSRFENYLVLLNAHEYIKLFRCTLTSYIIGNTFYGTQSGQTPISSCVLIEGVDSTHFQEGTLICNNNTTDSSSYVERLVRITTNPSYGLKMYLLNNIMPTSGDFLQLYMSDIFGISDITLSNNNVTLYPNTNFKGLISCDLPTIPNPLVNIYIIPNIRASKNTLPTDSFDSNFTLIENSTESLPILAYNTSKFSHETSFNIMPPAVLSIENIITQNYQSTLKVKDLETDDTFSLNQELQKISNIQSATNAPDPIVTNFDGEIHVAKIKSASHNTEIEFEQTGDMSLNTDGDITLTSVNGDVQLTASDIRLNSTTLTANGSKILTKDGDISIGTFSGNVSHGDGAVAIGYQAGESYQNDNSIAIGKQAGKNNQQANSIAIGNGSGVTRQGAYSVAIGTDSGNLTQGNYSVAIGYQAGKDVQDQYSVAIGHQSGYTNQKKYSVAIGDNTGRVNQMENAVAIGRNSGYNNQSTASIAIGYDAGRYEQGQECIAIGSRAGTTNQLQRAVAIGYFCGHTYQGENAVAIGNLAGQTNQATGCVAIGYLAGRGTQGQRAVAIGDEVASNSQGEMSIAMGWRAGRDGQGNQSVAIGRNAGLFTQGDNCIAIGNNGGHNGQKNNCIAIGLQAGFTNQGSHSIAIGTKAGESNMPSNSIIFNADSSNLPLNASSAGVYMSSIANKTETATSKFLVYDSSTKEIHTVNSGGGGGGSSIGINPSLILYKNVTQTAQANTGTKIIWDIAGFSQGLNTAPSHTSGNIYINTAGVYIITYDLTCTALNSTTGGLYQSFITVNNSQTFLNSNDPRYAHNRIVDTQQSSISRAFNGSVVLNLAVNDSIQLWVTMSSTVDIPSSNNVPWTRCEFTCTLIA